MSTINSISKNTIGGSLRTAQKASRAKAYSAEQLRTGKRVVSCKDDSSAVSISAGIKSRVISYTEGARNINEAVAALEIARNALDSISTNIAQMRAYTTRALTGMKSEEQIDNLGAFIQAGLENIDKTAEDAVFNGRNLFVDENLKINPTNEAMQTSLQFKAMSTNSMGLKAQDADAVFGAGFDAQAALGAKMNALRARKAAIKTSDVETLGKAMKYLGIEMYNSMANITDANFTDFFNRIGALNAMFQGVGDLDTMELDFAIAYPKFYQKLDQLRQDCAAGQLQADVYNSFETLGVGGLAQAANILHAKWLVGITLDEFRDSKKITEEAGQYYLELEDMRRRMDDCLFNYNYANEAPYNVLFTAIRAKKAEFINYLRNISNAVAHDADACKGYLATVEQSGQLAMINGERFSQWADAFQAQIEQAADYVQSSMMELGISQRMLEEDLYFLQSLSDASDEACFTLLDKDALEAQIDTVKNYAFLENCMTALRMMFTQIFNMQNLTEQLIDLLIEGPESTME